MENLSVPIDDNGILNETCPCGGSHYVANRFPNFGMRKRI